MNVSLFTPIVLLAGLLVSREQAIYWQLAFCLFGAAAALEMPALGGGTILPATLFMPFVFARAWAENYGHRYSRRMPVAVFWFGCTVVYGVVGATAYPRLFAGTMEVIALDWSAAAFSPLRPTSGNITQSAYAIGGVVAFGSMHAMLMRPGRIEVFRDAALLLASLNCGAAILNLAEYHLGLPSILTYVRTAYAVFGTYEIPGTGLVRIHGTFSETSAFSAFSLTLFAFCFSLWLHNVRPFYSGLLALLLVIFLLISTSSTALAGLGTYVIIFGFLLTYRGYRRGTVPRIGLLVASALLAIVVIGSAFVLETEIARRLEDFLAITIFEKAQSESGLVRAAWNRQAWYNFLDSYGLGLGIGTVRASSLLLVMLVNVGIPGTFCYLMFLKHAVGGTTETSHYHAPVPEAARQALLANMAAAMFSATVFDMGMIFYIFAAAACAQTPQTASGGGYNPFVAPRDTNYDHRDVS